MLLLDLEIEFLNDERTARDTYDDLKVRHPSAPRFDDLQSTGWIRLVWQRVRSALGTERSLRRFDEDTRAALPFLFERRDRRRFSVGPAATHAPELGPLIEEMQGAPQDVHHLDCPTPEWVIARLWDRAPSHLSDVEQLRFWVDRCDLLPDCYIAPHAAWDEPTADRFRDAAFEVFNSDTGLLSWEEMRRRLVARLTLLSGRATSDIQDDFGSIPSTYVDRLTWLSGRDGERVNDALDTCGDLWHLTNFLLCEIENTDHSAAPHPVAHRLFELATERPELLEFITIRLRTAPILLADMLLEPRLAALACVLVLQWSSGGGAWDRESRDRDDRSTRASAFADAFALAVYFVETEQLAPAELCSPPFRAARANKRPPVLEPPETDCG